MISLIVCIALAIVVVMLLVRIALMRKSMGEIASSLDTILDGDTNAVITVASGDKCIKGLAARLNTELRGLRARRIKYENGDRELKEAEIVPELSIAENSVVRQSNRAAMSRIFGNIIGNALKYSDGDFTVELHDDGQIIFKNHARSLDKLRVEKLFDRFYTVQEARGSTGLGLSIARSLVEQLGGSIWAEYEDGVLRIVVKV